MQTALIPVTPTELASLALLEDVRAAERYARNAKAKRTVAAYDSDWRDFVSYCRSRSLSYLPADAGTVATYLSWLSGSLKRKPATLSRRLAAINGMHLAHGHDSPASLRHNFHLKQVWDGIKRTEGTKQTRKKPAVRSIVSRLIAVTPPTRTGCRDRALLLLGFAGAFRRSELVGIKVEDIEYVSEGVRITIERSKTDQEGKGRETGVQSTGSSTCPVSALKNWLEEADLTSGYVFRPITRHNTLRPQGLSAQMVAKLVKRYALAAGIEPEKVKEYSGHSLRSGCATEAKNNGVNETVIMRHLGHKNIQTTMKYTEGASLFKGNVSGSLGL